MGLRGNRIADISSIGFCEDLRDYWYPLSFSKDLVIGDPPIGIHILGDPVVLYRDGQGQAACLSDRCAHRSAPLSCGKIVNGTLECRYHGWQYGADGQVTLIPAMLPGRNVPKSARTKSYPLSEQYGIIWVFPGSPDSPEADPAKIVNMSPGTFFGDEGWSSRPFQRATDLDIDFSLMIENLLDPAHIPFTHDGTIGRRKDACPLECELLEYDSPTYAKKQVVSRVAFVGRSQRSLIFAFTPPGTIQILQEDSIFHQTMYCVPLRPGHMRLLYTSSLKNLDWIMKLPILRHFNQRFSDKIVMQDYEMLRGQQLRLVQNARAWASPIQVDLPPKAVRAWLTGAIAERNPWFCRFETDQGISTEQDVEDIGSRPMAMCGHPDTTERYAEYVWPRQRGVNSKAYVKKYSNQFGAQPLAIPGDAQGVRWMTIASAAALVALVGVLAAMVRRN